MFSEFELCLLLILVEGRIKDLDILLITLDFYKNSMDSLEYWKDKSENTSALECTIELRDKIKKYLEE